MSHICLSSGRMLGWFEIVFGLLPVGPERVRPALALPLFAVALFLTITLTPACLSSQLVLSFAECVLPIPHEK